MRAGTRVLAAVAGVVLAVPAAPALAGGQRLEWLACPGVDDARLRCATVRVPLDHRPRHRGIAAGHTVDKRVHVPLLSGQGNACLTGGRPPAHDLAC
ncbi:hypothetical protein K1W54_31510 [Micromonospora sp. CPCC 205371]|nr:hypothetical protein [Micromonospora sp. CPCC 205371]